MNISENELLEVLRQVSQVPTEDGAVTMRELKEVWGKGDDQTRRLIHEAIKAGKMECVRVRRARIDGISTVVAAYRLKT